MYGDATWLRPEPRNELASSPHRAPKVFADHPKYNYGHDDVQLGKYSYARIVGSLSQKIEASQIGKSTRRGIALLKALCTLVVTNFLRNNEYSVKVV